MQKILNKKGQGDTNSMMSLVIVILMIAALGGTIFGATGLADGNLTANAPTWVVTLLTVGTGIALVRLIIR